MGILDKFKKNYEKMSIADLKIAEGNLMKKIDSTTKELSELNEEIDNIRKNIKDKQV